MEHFKICSEPFYYVKVDTITLESSVRPLNPEQIDEDKSLLNLVAQFIKQSPKHIAEAEARQAKEAKREAKLRQLEAMVDRSSSKAKEEYDTNTDEKQQDKKDLPMQHTWAQIEPPRSPTPKNNLLYLQQLQNQQTSCAGIMSAAVTNSMSQYLVNCASLEDLNLFAMSQGNPYQPISSSNKENAEMDLNDELQALQDVTCYSVYRKRCKKGRKYKEWKKDEIRDSDFDQMKFLEK